MLGNGVVDVVDVEVVEAVAELVVLNPAVVVAPTVGAVITRPPTDAVGAGRGLKLVEDEVELLPMVPPVDGDPTVSPPSPSRSTSAIAVPARTSAAIGGTNFAQTGHRR
jgi:hypothetical protein